MEDRVEDLLKTDDYSPTNFLNFSEAVIHGTSEEQEARITELLENRDFEALGRYMWNQSLTYWERIATDVAGEQLAKCSFPYDEE